MANMEILKQNTKNLWDSSTKIRKFLEELLDNSSFVETDVFLSGENLIYSEIPYGEGVITGYGAIGGYPVYVVAQNNEVLKGSLGKAHSDKIVKCINRAIKNRQPVVSIIDSAGLRIGEGIPALDGYAKIIKAINLLKQNNHHISVINGTATGLMSVYATTADFVFMGKDASLSFNTPMSVTASAGLDQKASEQLGGGVHTVKNQMVDFVFESPSEVSSTITSLFNYLDEVVVENNDDPNRTSAILNKEVNTDNLLSALCDDGKYLELSPAYAEEIKTVLASINSLPVGIIATNNRGIAPKLNKTSMSKIRNFISLLNAYDITLINLVDSQGVEISLEQEEKGLALSGAKLLEEIACSDITKISVITGSAIGFSYTALCSKDMGYDFVVAFPNASIAPMTADAAINFIYKDELLGQENPLEAREKLKEKYLSEEATPFISAKGGSVDNIIEPALLRPYIASVLTMAVE